MAKILDVPVPVADNISTSDVFADRAVGAFLNNGNVHITFVSRRCDHSKIPGVFTDVVTSRLVMPFVGAVDMVKFLEDFLEQMRKQIANTPQNAPKTLQ